MIRYVLSVLNIKMSANISRLQVPTNELKPEVLRVRGFLLCSVKNFDYLHRYCLKHT